MDAQSDAKPVLIGQIGREDRIVMIDKKKRKKGGNKGSTAQLKQMYGVPVERPNGGKDEEFALLKSLLRIIESTPEGDMTVLPQDILRAWDFDGVLNDVELFAHLVRSWKAIKGGGGGDASASTTDCVRGGDASASTTDCVREGDASASTTSTDCVISFCKGASRRWQAATLGRALLRAGLVRAWCLTTGKGPKDAGLGNKEDAIMVELLKLCPEARSAILIDDDPKNIDMTTMKGLLYQGPQGRKQNPEFKARHTSVQSLMLQLGPGKHAL